MALEAISKFSQGSYSRHRNKDTQPDILLCIKVAASQVVKTSLQEIQDTNGRLKGEM